MASPTTTSHPLRRLWDFAHDDHRAIVWGTVLSMLNKFFDVLPELLIGVAVDVVVRGRASLMAEWFGIDDRWTQLLVLAAVTVVVWGLESLTDYASTIVWRNLAQSIEHSARSELYRHLQTLELAWFEDRSSGGLLSVVNDDVNQLERFLDVGAREVIRTATNVVLVGIFFFVVSPVLALVAFLPIPIIVGGSLRYQRRLEPHYADVRQAVEDLSGTLTNNLGGIATISSFVAEEREAQRVEELSERYRHANERAIKVSSAFVPLIRMAILAAFVLTLLVGGTGGHHRHPRRRRVLHPGVHDPTAALAADPHGRGDGPLPTGCRLGHPHPQPAGGAARHRARRPHAAQPRAGRRALRRRHVLLRGWRP